MTEQNPHRGTGGARSDAEHLAALLLTLNPQDKRAMARKANDMALQPGEGLA